MPHPAWKQARHILYWIPIGIFCTRHVYSIATISGESMQPTFNPDLYKNPLHHDVVLLDKWSISLGRYRRGDVVTLWSPQDPRLLTTKRVVALEGDIVSPLPPLPPTPVRIPPGHCWVEGDSHYRTRDSNTYGPVPLGLINGRVTHIIWPWGRTGLVLSGQGKSSGRVQRVGEGWRL